jgi:hypothetical protein
MATAPMVRNDGPLVVARQDSPEAPRAEGVQPVAISLPNLGYGFHRVEWL